MPPIPEPSHASALASADGARAVEFASNILQGDRDDPGRAERHPKNNQRYSRDGPGSPGLDKI